MEKEFCTYEQSLALKELGFDERCFGHYNPNGVFFWKILCSDEDNDHTLSVKDIIEHIADGYVESPTYSQSFRWFREKHNLFHNIWNYTHGEPTDLIPNGFTFSIDEDWVTIIGKKEDGYFEKYYTTYEEAESACLDKLIEICKNK